MEYISAGDIEKYSYCPLSWWLSRNEKNVESEGVKKHREVGAEAIRGMKKYKESKDFEKTVLYLSLGATLVALMGLSMLYTSIPLALVFHSIAVFWLIVALYFLWRADVLVIRWNKLIFEKMMVAIPLVSMVASVFTVTFLLHPIFIMGYLLEISSMLWLIAAIFFLYLSLKAEIEYSKIRKKLKLPNGEIIYVDDMKKAPLLKSERYKIQGRPDLLIKIGKNYIPIEVKTGRIPRGPLFSHIMQLTAYMLLVEENYGTPPPYGILKYGPKIYRIEYGVSLKKLLLQKVEEMREALKTGEVHRNHHRVGKCVHCSRRDICPERLA